MQRDVERNYPRKDFIAKLHRLADALEHGTPFRIQVAGKRIILPGDAAIIVEHEPGGGAKEIEFQLKWRTARRPNKA